MRFGNLEIWNVKYEIWKAQMNVQTLDQPLIVFLLYKSLLDLHNSSTYDTHKMALLIHLGAHHHQQMHKEPTEIGAENSVEINLIWQLHD